MTTIHMVLLGLHVFFGFLICVLVLMQRGKGAEMGAAFGSGASATVFGAKGSANFLSRSTALLAALFFGTSLSLAYLGSQRPVVTSVIEQEQSGEPALKPAQDGSGSASTPVVPAAPPAGNVPPSGGTAPGTSP